jgi:type IV pilus assembly protein PilY1
MNKFLQRMIGSSLVGIIALLGIAATTATAIAAISIAPSPLFISASADPRVMLVMARDEQLYIKAYTDYTPLDSILPYQVNTTYTNTINYYGYFDGDKCYTYTSSRFEPSNTTSNHQCSSKWSGNFLNWATMTRMDIVRKVLYGGYRSTDTTTDTVLERVMLPFDAHAFVKVYAGSDISIYTPYSGSVISLCNVTRTSATSSPLLYVASGSQAIGITGWPRWASGEVKSCTWGSESNSTIYPPNANNQLGTGTAGLNVQIKVCVSGLLEDNCTSYGTTTIIKKPTGLLQKYAESNRPIRFGLFSGSYAKNQSGGVLRRNIGLLEDMTPTASFAAPYEINPTTGQFVNQATTDSGIINTLSRLRISKYNFTDKYSDCDDWGIPKSGKLLIEGNSASGCSDGGNPLSEMYLEALRYFAGSTTATSAFNANDSSYISSLPQVTWVDPTPSTVAAPEWCAYNAIIAISTGSNSFDTDQLSGHGITGLDASTETNAVGTQEGISGNYMVGCVGSTCKGGNNLNAKGNLCSPKAVSGLADVSGVCPEQPQTEGGYGIAGLAYYAHNNSLRSATAGGVTKNYSKIDTFGIALAENLPSLQITASGGNLTIVPACQALGNDPPRRTCGITDLIVEDLKFVAGRLVAGSVLVTWNDTLWGNDFDMDGIERLLFCTGSECNPTGTPTPGKFDYYLKTVGCPTTTNAYNDLTVLLPALTTVGNNKVAVISCVVQANAGNDMWFGYTVTGSGIADGAYPDVISRPGGNNFDMGSNLPSTVVTNPTLNIYTASGSTSALLQKPLWYAAKYGSFVDSDGNNLPNLDSEWKGSDGNPKGYFKATNPALLETALDKILGTVVSRSSTASGVATNSVFLRTGTVVFQAKFFSGDWSGHLLALPVDSSTGSINTAIQVWDAAEKLPNKFGSSSSYTAAASRKIFSYDPLKSGTSKGVTFDTTSTGLSAAQKLLLGAATGTIQTDMINYLRGDQTKEQEQGGTFRSRSYVLGDIVNSDPWFVSDRADPDIKYQDATYSSFLAGNATTRSKMLYFGANDGMLHGIEVIPSGSTSTSTASTDGVEKFAYIPNALFNEQYSASSSTLSKLTLLSSPDYIHSYFVDGSPQVGDAKFSDGWHTILVGSTGAGGRGIFALDVTQPDSFDASKVLWEFTSENDIDLGYMPQVTIAQVSKGKWAAIVGNGYNGANANHKAVLFIIYLDGSNLSSPIKLSTNVGNSTALNGLSMPYAADINDDQIAEYIYAGDLQGNLWRFQKPLVGGLTSDIWELAKLEGTTSAPNPLFVAKDGTTITANVQPITAQPVAAGNPNGYGLIIYVGTGEYFQTSDNQSPYLDRVQTFYAIKDDLLDVTASQVARASLQPRQFKYYASLSSGTRVVEPVADADAAADLSTCNASKGWYLDLKTPTTATTFTVGEQVIAPVDEKTLRKSGRALITSIVPANAATSDKCSYGGTTWFTLVDSMCGAPLDKTFDTNNDRKVDDSDKITLATGTTAAIGSVQSGSGIIKKAAPIDAGSVVDLLYCGTDATCGKRSIYSTISSGRQSWREMR